MKTKKPSAIVYGWYKQGEEILQSDVYWEEGLFDDVIVISLPYEDNVIGDYSKYQPDLIISIGNEINVPHFQLEKFHRHYIKFCNWWWCPRGVISSLESICVLCEVERVRY